MNYLKIYNELIDKCKKTEYSSDQYTEIHHILPRCMGGKDDKENLVKMTAREHIVAHLLLQRIYPNNVGLAYAIHAITSFKKDRRETEKYFSSRVLARSREEAWKLISINRKGKGNPMYGRSQSEKTKKLISKINTGRKFTEEQSKKHSINMKNRVVTDEWRKHISEGMKGKPHPHKSPTLTKEQKLAKSELCKSRTGGKHPNSKKVLDTSMGKIYSSITECSKDVGLSRPTVSKQISDGNKRFKLV